jgi:hypothetical protein
MAGEDTAPHLPELALGEDRMDSQYWMPLRTTRTRTTVVSLKPTMEEDVMFTAELWGTVSRVLAGFSQSVWNLGVSRRTWEGVVATTAGEGGEGGGGRHVGLRGRQTQHGPGGPWSRREGGCTCGRR